MRTGERSNPDRKVKEQQKKHPASYQSGGSKEHFESEGGEYLEKKSNSSEEDHGKLTDKIDIDKARGR
ncbi:MAG: hypothetical protein ACK40G_14325 [Cytophagaceae bacterium]